MDKHTSTTLRNSELLPSAVRILRAIAHPLRLQMIRVIHENNGSANVGEIFTALKIEQSVASQHLRILRQVKLVKTRRDQKFVFYSLDYERISNTVQAVKVFGKASK